MNTEQEIIELKKEVEFLKNFLNSFQHSDRYVFQKNLQLQDGRIIQIGVATGTVIGDGGSNKIVQLTPTKLGFFSTAPVVRHSVGGASTAGATYGATEQSMLQNLWNALRAYGLLS